MRNEISCIDHLKKYLTENPGWHTKGKLYHIAEDWSAETVGRRLRDLEEAREVQVDYYDGKYSKGLARYCAGERPKVEKKRVEIISGRAVMITYYE